MKEPFGFNGRSRHLAWLLGLASKIQLLALFIEKRLELSAISIAFILDE